MYYYSMLRLFSVFAGVWYKMRVIAKNKYEVLLSSLLTTASCDHRELLVPFILVRNAYRIIPREWPWPM